MQISRKCAIPAVERYELRDCSGQTLGATASYVEGMRMLQGFVMTSPGREDDTWLVSVTDDGREVLREGIFDVEVTLLSL